VDFLVSGAAVPTGNTLAENWITMNASGIKGPTFADFVAGNILEGNGADSCQ
jgi:hypothetical protein